MTDRITTAGTLSKNAIEATASLLLDLVDDDDRDGGSPCYLCPGKASHFNVRIAGHDAPVDLCRDCYRTADVIADPYD